MMWVFRCPIAAHELDQAVNVENITGTSDEHDLGGEFITQHTRLNGGGNNHPIGEHTDRHGCGGIQIDPDCPAPAATQHRLYKSKYGDHRPKRCYKHQTKLEDHPSNTNQHQEGTHRPKQHRQEILSENPPLLDLG
ncbi:MAG: hypothetical protein NTW99_08255 [Chloroflexi bacterium]|nr:hypothetical protein [Chloroflexota bacterium]